MEDKEEHLEGGKRTGGKKSQVNSGHISEDLEQRSLQLDSSTMTFGWVTVKAKGNQVHAKSSGTIRRGPVTGTTPYMHRQIHPNGSGCSWELCL